MKRDSNYRSKRYYQALNKPHIVLSRLSGLFIVYGDHWKFDDVLSSLDFSNKLNAARAKS